MVSVNDTIEDQQNNPELLDASSPEPDTTIIHPDPSKTNWPDAPTFQIPHVSSKLLWIHHWEQYITAELPYTQQTEKKYQKLKKMNMSRNMITVVITSSPTITLTKRVRELEENILSNSRIWKVNNTTMRWIEPQNYNTLYQQPPTTDKSSESPLKHLIKPHSDPLRNCIKNSAEEGERHDMMNYIATIPTEPALDLSKVKYNKK